MFRLIEPSEPVSQLKLERISNEGCRNDISIIIDIAGWQIAGSRWLRSAEDVDGRVALSAWESCCGVGGQVVRFEFTAGPWPPKVEEQCQEALLDTGGCGSDKYNHSRNTLLLFLSEPSWIGSLEGDGAAGAQAVNK